jgi:ribonuclease HI
MAPLKKVLIYTRGISSKEGDGAYGIVLLHDKHRKELSGSVPSSSNNRMDILAAIKSLEALKFNCQVVIYNNNTYLSEAMNKKWVNRWKVNGWLNSERKPVQHTDLWDRLLLLCIEHKVDFKYLKFDAHIHDYNRCDILARLAFTNYESLS